MIYPACIFLNLGSGFPRIHVDFLFFRQFVDFDVHAGKLQPGDFVVDLFRHAVNTWFERPTFSNDISGRQRLISEAHVHDTCWMAFRGGEIDQTTFSEHDQLLIWPHLEFFDERSESSPALTGHLFKRLDVDLRVEVAGVRHNGAVFHLFEMALVDDVDIARGCHEQVPKSGGAIHGRDREAVHRGLERAYWIDFGYDDARTHSAHAH